MAEDRKFKFEDGRFVNRVSGEAIPDDEPVIIFRARDRHALQVLYHYQQLCTDEHHQRAIEDRIQEFQAFRDTHPLKEPGVTRHIVLNSELGEATTAGKSGEDAVDQARIGNVCPCCGGDDGEWLYDRCPTCDPTSLCEHADARLRALESAAKDFRNRAHICRSNLDAYDATAASVWDMAADELEKLA